MSQWYFITIIYYIKVTFSGGTVSSVAVACTGKKYKSVVVILRDELTQPQKQRLINAVGKILNNVGPQDFVKLLTFVLSNPAVKEEILKEIGNFLFKELSYKLV